MSPVNRKRITNAIINFELKYAPIKSILSEKYCNISI